MCSDSSFVDEAQEERLVWWKVWSKHESSPESLQVGRFNRDCPLTGEDDELKDVEELLQGGMMPDSAHKNMILYFLREWLVLADKLLENLLHFLIVAHNVRQDDLDQAQLFFEARQCLYRAEARLLVISCRLPERVDDTGDYRDARVY